MNYKIIGKIKNGDDLLGTCFLINKSQFIKNSNQNIEIPIVASYTIRVQRRFFYKIGQEG